MNICLQLPAWPYKRWRRIHVQQFPESLVQCPPCWSFFLLILSRVDFLFFFFQNWQGLTEKWGEEEMNSNQEFHSLRVEITVCRIFERPFKSFAKKALGFTSRHHIKNACWVLFDKVVKLAQKILSMKILLLNWRNFYVLKLVSNIVLSVWVNHLNWNPVHLDGAVSYCSSAKAKLADKTY